MSSIRSLLRTATPASSLSRSVANRSLRGLLNPEDDEELTDAQAELLPYVQREAREEAAKRGLLQPVEFIFDVLQRGQYLTANIVRTISDNIKAGRPVLTGTPEAVIGAISGRVKGDWKHVLFGGTSPGAPETEGLVPWDPQTKGGKVARGAAGFLANVLLDPTTYVSFGSSTVARSAAARVGDDAARVFIRDIGGAPEKWLPELVQKGYDHNRFVKFWNESQEKGYKYLRSYAGDDITKIYSRVQKEATQRALRTPGHAINDEFFESVIRDVTGIDINKVSVQAAVPDLLRPGLERGAAQAAPIAGAQPVRKAIGETAEQTTTRMARDIPDVVQRFDDIGIDELLQKPGGATTSPADLMTPRSDIGDNLTLLSPNPRANIMRVEAGGLVDMPSRGGIVGKTPGITAAEEFFGPQEVHFWLRMPTDKLVDIMRKRYRTVPWKRYVKNEDIIEAAAGLEARARGFDAIWAFDKKNPAFSEFLGLTDNAFIGNGKKYTIGKSSKRTYRDAVNDFTRGDAGYPSIHVRSPKPMNPVQFSGAPPGISPQLAGETADQYGRRMLEYLENPYKGAGTRAIRIFRKEFNVTERYPTWLKQMDKLKGRFKKSNIGGKFSDAWWTFLNHRQSPVAVLRKALRIRNPHQKMLSIMERDVQERAFHELLVDGENISQIMKSMTDEERMGVTGSMIWSELAQEMQKKKVKEAGGVFPVILSAKEDVRKFATEGMDIGKMEKSIDDINQLTGKWLDFNRKAYQRGLSSDIGEWQDYLPIQANKKAGWKRAGQQLSGPQPAYAKARETGWMGHLSQELEKIKFQFPQLTDEQSINALHNELSNLNLDMADMLTRRAFAQSRFQQRIYMLDQFREFGVDVSQLRHQKPELYEALAGQSGDLGSMGLKRVGDPALEGILFDGDIADIFERAIQVTSDTTAWDSMGRAFGNYTSWWRGWATLSPGFHMRNFLSNNMTGYLKHGVEWLDPEVQLDALIMTHVALHGRDGAMKSLKSLQVPEDWVAARMAKRYGEYALEDLAEYAGMTGIATRVTRGFNKPKDYDDMMKMQGRFWENVNVNPFSRKFTPMEMSHGLGSYVESHARLTSFLLDFKRASSQGGAGATSLEWAKREAKKWFIDYGDLSKAEQVGLRNVIPFYTWLRGNIANQISGLMQMPEMYSMVAKATTAIRSEGGTPQEEMPEWARELGMIPVGPGQGQGKERFFWPNFPYQDLNRIPIKFRATEGGFDVPTLDFKDTLKDIISDSHPVLKSIIEVATGKDIFYENEIGETEKAPRAMRILTKIPEVTRFLDGALRRIGFRDGLRIDKDKQGRMLIDGKIAKVLKNNLLMLERLPQYWDLPELIFPVLEEWKRKATGAEDDYEALEEFFQVMSFYAGIKFKDIDMDEAEFWRKERIIESAQESRSSDMRGGQGADQRRLEWEQKQETLHQRMRL